MHSKFYFNPIWSKTRQGLNIPLWGSLPPEHLTSIRPYIFIGGMHGDEPEGVWLAEAFLNAIFTKSLRQCHKNHKSPWKVPWFLIPCLNPEGYSKNERTNSNSVDLNRNFPSLDWSPESTAPRYNPGVKPGSEPEIQSLVNLIEITKPQLIIHFHSWKPFVIYTGASGEEQAQCMSTHSGYPCREDIGYPTPGSLGQYAWLNHKIPVICLEEQEGTPHPFIWRRFGWPLLELIT